MNVFQPASPRALLRLIDGASVEHVEMGTANPTDGSPGFAREVLQPVYESFVSTGDLLMDRLGYSLMLYLAANPTGLHEVKHIFSWVTIEIDPGATVPKVREMLADLVKRGFVKTFSQGHYSEGATNVSTRKLGAGRRPKMYKLTADGVKFLNGAASHVRVMNSGVAAECGKQAQPARAG